MTHCQNAASVAESALPIGKGSRAHEKHQDPVCVWLTGLPGAGKSTIAGLLEERISAWGRHAYVLDGDNIRSGLNSDLGYSEADRIENIRRVAEVARLFVDAGVIAIVALISPYRAQRDAARARFATKEFFEVFVDAPLEECERRDPKGLYAKARRGELANFTGIDSRYEAPFAPDVELDTVALTAEQCVDRLLQILDRKSGWDLDAAYQR
jgi:bifunctional enzyme CysN/CysC